MTVIALSQSEGSGSGSGSAEKLPKPQELAKGTVALVTHVPGKRGTITAADLRHAIQLSAAQEGLPAVPRPGAAKYQKTEEFALNSLFDQTSIQGQAKEMGIAFTPKQVISQFELIEKKSFKNQAQYVAFLKKSHLTQSDALERVELELLNTSIQNKVTEGIKGKAAKQAALSKFASAYSRRWRSRTVCAPKYAVARCSNGPPLPSSSGSVPSPAP